MSAKIADRRKKVQALTYAPRREVFLCSFYRFHHHSPRRVRRRKDPTPYNVLIISARNSGKTSFLNFLKTSLALPAKS